MGLPQVPHRWTHLELAEQPLGSAEPPADVRLTRTADPVELSSKLFLLSADAMLHALASASVMRMLRQEDLARVPDFAGQRVRQASVVVQVIDGAPLRMVHSTFYILDINPEVFLDVDRLNNQQISRLDVSFDRSRPADEVVSGPVITLLRDLSLGAALASLTRAFCAISKPPRWGRCHVLEFDCFGDGLEARSLIDSAALMGASFQAKRLASHLDRISSSGSLPVQAGISGIGQWTKPLAR